jgi:hypothetical protein
LAQAWVGLAVACLALAAPGPALACSPPFEQPTIAGLGPGRVVLLGFTGARVPSGRLFHVERAWGRAVPSSPIVIVFKEGEAVGDCSYPVAAGTRLIIAPETREDGALTADLATLQADPNTDDGRRYLAEAQQLYGEGTVPVDVSPADDGWGTAGALALVLLALLVLLAILALAWRRVGARPS